MMRRHVPNVRLVVRYADDPLHEREAARDRPFRRRRGGAGEGVIEDGRAHFFTLLPFGPIVASKCS